MKITKISQKGLNLIKKYNKYYVYFHINPTNGKVFYIGKGCNKRAFERKSRNAHWQNIVNKYGHEVCIVEDNLTNEEAYLKEIRLISFYGLNNLCNMTIGGEGCVEFKEEVKIRISNSLKGKIQSIESRQKRIISSKKAWENEELRELKRKQSTLLNKLGIIGAKGKESKKKGIPFQGDKHKLSISLKKHYENNTVWNKKQLDILIVDEIILEYKNGISEYKLSKKYNINRKIIHRVLLENNIKLHPKRTLIKKELLYNLYIKDKLTRIQCAEKLNCSEANIDKLCTIYKIKKK